MNKVFLFFIFLFLTSCLQVDCEEAEKHISKLECLQIFEKLPSFESYRLKSEGIHLNSGQKCICDDETRWLGNYVNLLKKGDTIIKRKDELIFSIHKIDTVITVKWKCGELDDSEIKIKGEIDTRITIDELMK